MRRAGPLTGPLLAVLTPTGSSGPLDRFSTETHRQRPAGNPHRKASEMAKDKSTKPGKSKGGNDEFAKPSDAPASGGDGWKFESDDNLGDLFLITPLREKEIEDTYSKVPGATKTVIVADIVHLNEKKPEKSEEHPEAWVFGGWTKGSLRGYIGERKVLGRLGQGAKDRGNIPWILEDADDDDVAIAKAYLENVDPFKQSSADKAKADKPAKDKGAKAGKSGKSGKGK